MVGFSSLLLRTWGPSYMVGLGVLAARRMVVAAAASLRLRGSYFEFVLHVVAIASSTIGAL